MFKKWQSCLRTDAIADKTQEYRELPDTPAGRAGWAVGDVGTVAVTSTYFEKGARVRLVRDNGTRMPFFNFVDAFDELTAPLVITKAKRDA